MTTSRQTADVIKTRSFPGWRRRTSSHIGKVQTTSPIPANRQMMTALFRWRMHWKTSHTTQLMKAIHDSHHSRTRRLKRKNRRHHGLSAECTGPGKIEATNSRKPVTMSWQSGRPYDFQYARSVPSMPTSFLPKARHSKMNMRISIQRN